MIALYLLLQGSPIESNNPLSFGWLGMLVARYLSLLGLPMKSNNRLSFGWHGTTLYPSDG